MSDLISRQAALKEAYKIVVDGDTYEVVQVETLIGLPSVEPTLYGYNIKHLELIAEILQKEGLSPDRVLEALTDISSIIEIIQNEFVERLQEVVNK